jgi:hypothetical protein
MATSPPQGQSIGGSSNSSAAVSSSSMSSTDLYNNQLFFPSSSSSTSSWSSTISSYHASGVTLRVRRMGDDAVEFTVSRTPSSLSSSLLSLPSSSFVWYTFDIILVLLIVLLIGYQVRILFTPSSVHLLIYEI